MENFEYHPSLVKRTLASSAYQPKEMSAFVTPERLYQYKVMPFGMKNTSAKFQRLISEVVSDFCCCEACIDDVLLRNDFWNTILKHFKDCLIDSMMPN